MKPTKPITEQELQQFKENVQKLHNRFFKKYFKKLPPEIFLTTVESNWGRIEKTSRGKMETYCVVNLDNGNIHAWDNKRKCPEKWSRGNINDKYKGMRFVGPWKLDLGQWEIK